MFLIAPLFSDNERVQIHCECFSPKSLSRGPCGPGLVFVLPLGQHSTRRHCCGATQSRPEIRSPRGPRSPQTSLSSLHFAFFFFFLHFTLIWVFFFFSVNLSPLDKLLYPQGVTLSSGKEWCHATLDGWLRKILSSLGSWPGKTCPFPLCKEKSVATRQAHGSLAGEQATSQKKGTTVRNYVTLLTKANQRSCI